MNTPIRYLMVGGFLGAGKTTAIARLARHYLNQGLQVGLVTNDQATDLVDTHSLRAQGFRVGEVPGACFCCSFNQLIATLSQLRQDQVPDVVIAEPVGSCTDLVSTVVEPMKRLHADRYSVGPLAVLLKPEHGRKILCRGAKAGFSPQAAYIFLKQIEEADVVAVNKIDKLSAAERDELIDLVRRQYPGKRVMAVSARLGDGFEQLVQALNQPRPCERTVMDVDYDIYARGEAELGWLNCQLTATRAGQPFALDRLVWQILDAMANRLGAADAETAHVKILGQYQHNVAIGNLVSADTEGELSLESGANVPEADVIINARVAMEPIRLESLVRDSLDEFVQSRQYDLRVGPLRAFQPGRPTPTYRVLDEPGF